MGACGMLSSLGRARSPSPKLFLLPLRHVAGSEILLPGTRATTNCSPRDRVLTYMQAAVRRLRQTAGAQVGRWQQQRGVASSSEPYDAVIIGGGELPRRIRSDAMLTMHARPRWLRRCDQGRSARSAGELILLVSDQHGQHTQPVRDRRRRVSRSVELLVEPASTSDAYPQKLC